MAKLCARLFPVELLRHLEHGLPPGEALTRTYLEVDAALEMSGKLTHSEPAAPPLTQWIGPPPLERRNQFDYVGTTAVTVLVDLNSMSLTIANAGDSRAVLCRGGTVLELTHDHKPESPR